MVFRSCRLIEAPPYPEQRSANINRDSNNATRTVNLRT